MNAIALHITDNLCHRIPDTPVVYSDIAYLSAVTERLQCCLAYIREFGIRNALKKLNRQLKKKVADSFGNIIDI